MIKKRGRGTLKDRYRKGIAAALAPLSSTVSRYAAYRDNLAEFPIKELGVQAITPAQRKIAEAIVKYEVVVVMSATGVGKTFILAAIAVGLFKSREEIEIYTAAASPESNLRKLLWGEIGRMVSKNPIMFQNDKKRSLEIWRADKQFITGVTIPQGGESNPEVMEARFSGKHQKNLVFIFDEGDAIPDAVYKGADGCMSGGWARMIICLNPRRKSGAVYQMIKQRRAHVISMSALDHPNVVSGEEVIPGAVTREKTVKRINEWCEWVSPELVEDMQESTLFELPEFLEGAVATASNGEEYLPLRPGKYRIVENQFYYKVLGMYPPSSQSQLIPDDAIDQARANWELYVAKHGMIPPRGVRPMIGLDVADMGDDGNVLALKYGHFIPPLMKWSGIDPDQTADKAEKVYKNKNAKGANVDSIGVGAGVPGKMSRNGCLGAVGIKITEASRGHSDEGEFKTVYDEAYWALRMWFKSGNAMIPPDERLDESLRAITYEVIGENVVVQPKKKLKKKLGYSPDEMEAIMLLFAEGNTWMGGI